MRNALASMRPQQDLLTSGMCVYMWADKFDSLIPGVIDSLTTGVWANEFDCIAARPKMLDTRLVSGR